MTGYVRIFKGCIKTALLVVIAVLLAMNLFLPAKYTLQLIPVARPPLQQAVLAEIRSESAETVQTPNEAANVSTTGRRDETNLETKKDVSVALAVANKTNQETKKTFASFLRRTLNDNKKNNNNDKVPEEKNKLDPQSRRPRLTEQKHGREIMDDFFGKREGYGADPNVSGPYRVNFHDSVQRLPYYQMLRRRRGGSDARLRLNRRQSVNRKERIRDIWGGWFENDEDSVDMESLNSYVTEETTPLAIEAELAACATVLGMPKDTLESQREDLQKSSIKLSAFLAAIKFLVPDSFLPRYASPCWLSDKVNGQSNLIGIISRVIGQNGFLNMLPDQANDLAQQAFKGPYPQRLFCLPHFFLAGFPKSATTTLARALFEHKSVSGAVVKEPHWWTRAPIISPSVNMLKLNMLRYLIVYGQMAHLASHRPELLSMDGSQSTLWDSNFVVNGHDFCSIPSAISHILPKAKFIVLMREPSERLYSRYLWSCSNRYGNNTNQWPARVRGDAAGNFHREISRAVNKFNDCLKTSSLYECTNRYTFTNSTRIGLSCGGFRMVVSIYYIYIVKFLHFFPREQFLFLRTEDMSKEPVRFMNQITDFLGVEPYSPFKARDLLEQKVNRQKAAIEGMWEDTRLLLQNFFAPFNRKLASLLKDDRFLWDYS